VVPPDTILPFQLQPDSDLCCNWYTLRVANTKRFRLILYHPFSCNWTVVRFAIDVHSELQILSASPWYCTTLSVVTGPWFELQSMYTLSCKYWVLLSDTVLPLLVATGQWFELQTMCTLSCKYWVLPPNIVLPLPLQPDSGSSCNRCTLQDANIEFSRISPSEWFALYNFPFWRHSN
jgi:hypothetical protein